MRIRTVTVFVHTPPPPAAANLHRRAVPGSPPSSPSSQAAPEWQLEEDALVDCIRTAKAILTACEAALKEGKHGASDSRFEVQTLRIAFTDPKIYLGAYWPHASCDEGEIVQGTGDGESEVPRAKVPKTTAATATATATTTATRRRPTPSALMAALKRVDAALEEHGIQFCSLGRIEHPSQDDLSIVPEIIGLSNRLNVSVNVMPGDMATARAVAEATKQISTQGDGLGNFRFCASACCDGDKLIPFFPAANAIFSDLEDSQAGNIAYSVGVGLENGHDICEVMKQAKNVAGLERAFHDAYLPVLQSIEAVVSAACEQLASGEHNLRVAYAGIDTSFNPSLDAAPPGSIAAAFEELDEVSRFGDLGTIAAVARATQIVQNLPIQSQIGYRGLMLPVCEDKRLARLGEEGLLKISTLLLISSVCGVGIDTVPIAGEFDTERLARLYLDVSGLAHRWGKPLSCRVFPVPGISVSDVTPFQSPYLVNTKVLPLD